jgi:DNA modification methylase
MDCFMGSGSTGKAVMYENKERNANYKFIGIEMNDEYLPICQARIDFACQKDEVQEQEDYNLFNMEENE